MKTEALSGSAIAPGPPSSGGPRKRAFAFLPAPSDDGALLGTLAPGSERR